MAAGSLSDRIDALKKRLAYRCHRYVHEGMATKNQLAKSAGLSWTLIKDVGDPKFDASLKTLKALEAAIPGEWGPSVDYSIREPVQRLDLGTIGVGRSFLKGEKSAHDKVFLDTNAVSEVEPTQMAKVQRFLEQRRGRDGIIREGLFDFDVFKALAPQCATHLFDIDDLDPGNFLTVRWDASTGFNGGVDYSGTSLKGFDDAALLECVARDYLMVRETGWSHFSAVSRQFKDKGNRRFLRLIVPMLGADGRRKMVSVTRPSSFVI
jgi:hypothetical protein